MSPIKSARRPRTPVARAARSVIEGLERRQLFSGTLSLSNPFTLPASDRLIFNQIGNPNTYSPTNVVHAQQTLTLNNTGATALTINSLTLSGPFAFVSTTATPIPENGYNGITVQPGKGLTVTVRFTQASVPAHSSNQTNYTDHTNGGAYIGGSLTISTDDPATPTKVVALAGYYQQLSNNSEEPSLQTVVNRLAGYQTVLGSTTSSVDFPQPSGQQLYGSEVYAPSWEAANAAAPVTVQQLDAFHTQGNNATLYWYQASNLSPHQLLRSTGAQAQTILPTVTDTNTTPLTKSFSPGVAFGFRVDGEYSNDTVNVQMNNGGGGGHHFRFWPLVDQNGVATPNTYIVGMDYGIAQAENFDFNDNVYIVANIRPSGTPDTPTNLTATRGATPTLSWTASTYAGTTYNVYRATSAAGPFTKITAAPVTTTTYTDATAPTGVSYYQVTGVDAMQTPNTESPPASVTANGGPVAVDYTYAAVSGAGQVVDPLANVTDPTGTVAPTTVQIAAGPNHGGTATVDAATGQISYTPLASYTGVETVQYTVADSNGDRSSAGTITFNVSATPIVNPPGGTTPPTGTPGVLTVNPYIAQAKLNTAISIPVLTADFPATTFDLSTLTVTKQPGNGNAVADTTAGTITFNPGMNVVGGTSFQYTIADANGTVSSAVTVSVNVGVSIGAGTTYKSLSYKSENKTPVTVSLNRGTATVYFDGTGTVATPLGRGKIANVQGSNLYARGVELANTTAASTLTMKSTANAPFRLAAVFGSTLGTLNAAAADLQTNGAVPGVVPGNAHPSGEIDLAGARTVRLHSAASSIINLGNGSGNATAVQFAAGVSGTTLASAVPITRLQAANWLALSTQIVNTLPLTIQATITAPSIASLVVPGEFDADLTLTTGASGRFKTLGSARVGPVTAGTWSIAGNTGAVTLASAGTGFGGVNAAGSVASFTVAKGDLLSDVTAGAVGNFRVAGTFGGSLLSQGNLNTVTAGMLVDATIRSGTDASLSGVTKGNIGTGTIRSVRVTSRAVNAFNDTTVIAQTILSANTGQVNAATSSPEGLAASRFGSAVVGLNGGALRFNAASLASNDAKDAYISARGATLGNFQIVVV